MHLDAAGMSACQLRPASEWQYWQVMFSSPLWRRCEKAIGCSGSKLEWLPGSRIASSRGTSAAATVIVHPTARAAIDLVAAHLRGAAPALMVLPPRAYPEERSPHDAPRPAGGVGL